MNKTLIDGLYVLYHQAKFGEERTTRAGCRCENVVYVFLFVYRQDAAKRQTAGNKFTYSQAKNQVFFAPHLERAVSSVRSSSSSSSSLFTQNQHMHKPWQAI